MKLKEGASLKDVSWRMFDAAIKVESVLAHFGVDTVITAGTDGKHMVGSLHYRGLALDVRTRDLKDEDKQPAATAIRQVLGADFDVVLEGDHFHIEHDPKG